MRDSNSHGLLDPNPFSRRGRYQLRLTFLVGELGFEPSWTDSKSACPTARRLSMVAHLGFEPSFAVSETADLPLVERALRRFLTTLHLQPLAEDSGLEPPSVRFIPLARDGCALQHYLPGTLGETCTPTALRRRVLSALRLLFRHECVRCAGIAPASRDSKSRILSTEITACQSGGSRTHNLRRFKCLAYANSATDWCIIQESNL